MNTKQVQALLTYLGYDTGGVDGVLGQKTKAAVYDFQMEYGSLEVDGLPGGETQRALPKAVYDGWRRPTLDVEKPQEKPLVTQPVKEPPGWWKDIKYFTRDEFRCPCGKCGGFPVEPNERLVREVNTMRDSFGKAVIVVPPDGHSGGSGVRCQAYNDSLKGSVPNSRHVQGKAADFLAPGVPAAAIEAYLGRIKAAGKIRYWYRISSGSYHMDVE